MPRTSRKEEVKPRRVKRATPAQEAPARESDRWEREERERAVLDREAGYD